MKWLPHPITIKGELVTLVPLESLHLDELIALAKDKRIWQHYSIDGSDALKLKTVLEHAVKEREKGNQYPFVIVNNDTNELIGSTRFLDIQPLHKKLEIGWTWLHSNYWGTTINTECKLLLLSYSFEELEAKRVQLKTDENNIRSRKAIEKIGGQFEGILRNDMVRDNGTSRHSAYYSIIDSEWTQVKQHLINKLNQA
ncbi:MAG: GNAT family N-acetyltransferase [Bacteroidetes bacterium]|nr:GNAT family N-acetyltransferase [Bacteroidota bacterium]